MHRLRTLVALAFATALLPACKNSKPYQELTRVNGGHISYVAAFVDLLEKGTKTDAEETDELAAEFARSRIATRIKSIGEPPAGLKTTPETAAVSGA